MTKKIFLDAGHGGSDPGAVKYVTESKVAISVVKAAASYLRNNYICEVEADTTPNSTTKISSDANKWGADLFISVHFNAGGGSGWEGLVYSSANNKLGKTFEKQILAIGQDSRGVKYRPDLNVLRSTNMPAILNEMAFVDNKKDIKDWDEPAELKEMGIALAKAAAAYLKLKKKKAKETQTPFRVKAKKNLIVRSTAALTSKKLQKTVKKGEIYTIIAVKGNRGALKSGGWITITDKFVDRL